MTEKKENRAFDKLDICQQAYVTGYYFGAVQGFARLFVLAHKCESELSDPEIINLSKGKKEAIIAVAQSLTSWSGMTYDMLCALEEMTKEMGENDAQYEFVRRNKEKIAQSELMGAAISAWMRK